MHFFKRPYIALGGVGTLEVAHCWAHRRGEGPVTRSLEPGGGCLR